VASTVIRNFMRQQGFSDEPDAACQMHFAGLSFQPRVIAAAVVAGILLGSAELFLILAAVLWWNIVFPRWNVFELFYNRFVAARRGTLRLTPAPAPRRFAQGMAATFMLVTGVALLRGWTVLAWVFAALLVVALAALLFGKLCLGSYVYHLLRGRREFAHATLPWAGKR
jgi:hypothetical protein